jgi:uncharacterized protein (DUF433 family)
MAMVLAIETEQQVPLRVDESGAVRVGNTRVLLELVVGEYLRGSDAEEIVNHFPALELADVHMVIAYYLRHKAEIEAYIEQVEREGEQIRQEIEAKQDLSWFRERVQARKHSTEG